MAKINPFHQNSVTIAPDTQKARDFLSDLNQAVEKDIQDRAQWVDRKAYAQRLRYGLENRNPDWPWPNSSNIVMPLVDKTIDQLKPQYANLVLAAKPPVTVIAEQKAFYARTAKVEMWFEWLLKYGSPRFQENLIFGIDDILEVGFGVYKSMWRYETIRIPEEIRVENLPQRLRMLIPAPSEQAADEINAQLTSTGVKAAVLAPKEWKEFRPKIEAVILSEFQLDKDEPRDKRAISDLMGWLESGADGPLVIHKRDVVINAPALVHAHPIDVVVPAGTRDDPEDAERITHLVTLNESQIRQRVGDSGWNAAAVESLFDKRKKSRSQGRAQIETRLHRQDYDLDQSYREGMQTSTSLFAFREICTWRDGQREVVVQSEDLPDMPLKWYVYPRQRWPYHKSSFEQNKDRWYSPRGVPERLKDLQEEITFQHRQKLNRMLIANSPTFLYRALSGLIPENFRWTPGQFLAVRDVDRDVRSLDIPNMQMSEEREEQILRTWAEEYIGGTDFGLSNPLSNLQEARTATEIRGIQTNANRALSLRGAIFQRCMQGVYGEFFKLWHQWGPQQSYVKLTKDSEPITLTKEELEGNFEFRAIGTIGQQDPAVEAQKKLARIQILMQVKQLGLLEPTHEIDMGAAISDWLSSEDERFKMNVLRERTPQEVQQIQEEQKRQEDLLMRANTNQGLNEEEASEAAARLEQLQKKMPFKGAQRITNGQPG